MLRRLALPAVVSLTGALVLAGGATKSQAAPPVADVSPRLAALVSGAVVPDRRLARLVPGYRSRELAYFVVLGERKTMGHRWALERAGARVLREYGELDAFAVASRPAVVARISALPGVSELVPVDVIETEAETEVDQSRATTADVGAPALWNQGITGTGIRIAVLDTGLDATHPDLDDRDFRKETRCNTDPNGVIGGIHFWSLPVAGQAGISQRNGAWFYPNPGLLADPLSAALAGLGRLERACTIHVFRMGGNGTAGPGPIQAGFDGVSRLPSRELVSAHYGAGVWHLDFSSASSSLDGIAEDPQSTWGNTRGWNVMPGAETWSAKEYKGFVYTGDMGRGFDVYGFTTCDGLGCVIVPRNLPGSTIGGGQVTDELAELSILSGSAAGGKATFGFSAAYQTGQVAPAGDLKFTDKGSGRKVTSTSIDAFDVVGTKLTFTGRATVNGVPGVRFFVEAEDLGEPGRADTFRLVLQDGYAAGGVLLKGNIQVSS